MTEVVMLLVGALYLGVAVLVTVLVPLSLAAGSGQARRDLTMPLGAAVGLAVWFVAASTAADNGILQRTRVAVFTRATTVADLGSRRTGLPALGSWSWSSQASYQVIFGISAGVGDILVGLRALGAATAVRQGRLLTGVWWNVLGLFDLALAPTFIVRLDVWLHVVSLRGLVGQRAERRSGVQLSGATAT